MLVDPEPLFLLEVVDKSFHGTTGEREKVVAVLAVKKVSVLDPVQEVVALGSPVRAVEDEGIGNSLRFEAAEIAIDCRQIRSESAEFVNLSRVEWLLGCLEDLEHKDFILAHPNRVPSAPPRGKQAGQVHQQ